MSKTIWITVQTIQKLGLLSFYIDSLWRHFYLQICENRSNELWFIIIGFGSTIEWVSAKNSHIFFVTLERTLLTDKSSLTSLAWNYNRDLVFSILLILLFRLATNQSDDNGRWTWVCNTAQHNGQAALWSGRQDNWTAWDLVLWLTIHRRQGFHHLVEAEQKSHQSRHEKRSQLTHCLWVQVQVWLGHH